MAFSPDGKRLAVGSYREVRVVDLETKASAVLGSLSGPVRCLAWSADGTRLAAGGGKPGEAGEVEVFSAQPGAAQAPVAMGEHRDVVESVAFSPNGDAVLSAGMDEKALVTELSSRKVLAAMQDHTNRVTAVAVSPSRKYIATGSLDKTVKLWSGTDYKPLANLDANVGQVYALAFLPGEQLAVAGEDGNVRIYRISEARTGKLAGLNTSQVRTFNGNRTPILSLAASPKGDLLVAAGFDHTVRVFDLNRGAQKQLLQECPDAVYSVSVSPDGSLIAAGCRDGKVRLWNPTDGKLAQEL